MSFLAAFNPLADSCQILWVLMRLSLSIPGYLKPLQQRFGLCISWHPFCAYFRRSGRKELTGVAVTLPD